MSNEGEQRGPRPEGARPPAWAEPPVPEPIELPTNPPEPGAAAGQSKGEAEAHKEAHETGASKQTSEPEASSKASEETSSEASSGAGTPPAARPAGRIRHQDPESATPREPTLAERRARERALRRQREAERARRAEEAHRKKLRKRVLIGGGVTVGVVSLIAMGYAASQPDEIEARCVDENNVVVDESNCVQPAPTASSGYYGGGFVPFPVFIGSGGRQYHYHYGGSGKVGQVITGGTTVAPKDATVKTQSGRIIQRGGFGVSKSGGGKSGGS